MNELLVMLRSKYARMQYKRAEHCNCVLNETKIPGTRVVGCGTVGDNMLYRPAMRRSLDYLGRCLSCRVWRCSLQLCIDRGSLQTVAMDASCLIETGRNSTGNGDFVLPAIDTTQMGAR